MYIFIYLYLYMCVCECVCLCVCLCIRTRTHICMHIHTYMYIHLLRGNKVEKWGWRSECVCVCVHAHVHTYVCIYIAICIYIYFADVVDKWRVNTMHVEYAERRIKNGVHSYSACLPWIHPRWICTSSCRIPCAQGGIRDSYLCSCYQEYVNIYSTPRVKNTSGVTIRRREWAGPSSIVK